MTVGHLSHLVSCPDGSCTSVIESDKVLAGLTEAVARVLQNDEWFTATIADFVQRFEFPFAASASAAVAASVGSIGQPLPLAQSALLHCVLPQPWVN